MNCELYWDGSDVAGRNDRLFAMLQTEAAVKPSVAGHTQDAAGSVGSIADAQFERMAAQRLFAEFLL